MSNILKVFNPPPQRELSNEETMDCLPCQIMSSVFSLGFGTYLLSGKPFQYSDYERQKRVTLKEFQKRNPAWWVNGLRGFGGFLILFGLVRGSEGLIWNKGKQYKPW